MPLAEYAFPDVGPSGTRGFADRESIIHRHDPCFGHGDAFREAHLSDVIGRLWGPFLELAAAKLDSLPGLGTPIGAPWRPTYWLWPLRLLTAILTTLVILALHQLIVGTR